MVDDTQIQDVTYALAASPSFARDGVCFAARGSGLYRSGDSGKTWQPAYDSLDLEAPLATMAVAVSPAFESDQHVFAGVLGGVLRSYDGGRSWQVTTLPPPPPLVSSLVVSPNYVHDGTVLAGTLEDGVFRSADRGGRWAAWNFGLLDLNVLCMAISAQFERDETLYVGTETGIFRSTNGGRAWREVGLASEFAPVLSLALSPDYAKDGILFAGTESCGLFRSDNRAHSWKRLADEVITGAVNAIVLSAKVPAKQDALVPLGAALLISRDGGASWSDWQDGLTLESGIASTVAPQGLEQGSPLLVGLVKGGVLRI